MRLGALLACLLFASPAVAQVTLSPLPIQHFVDQNGVALSGGKLFTYSAGTTTKLATYTDSAGGTQQTNPIILNARGEPENSQGASVGIWLGAGPYKLVLAPSTDTDPPTNPIWTLDNVTAVLTPTIAVPVTINGSGTVLTGTLTVNGSGTEGNGAQIINQTHLGANQIVVAGLGIFCTSTGDNAHLEGCYGLFSSVTDAPGTTSLNKGKLSGIQSVVSPNVARNNTPFDDVTAMALNNHGTANGTEALYFGHCNACAPYDFTSGIGMDAWAFYGMQLNGHYSYGIDLGSADLSPGNGTAIRIPTDGLIQSKNGGSDVPLLSGDSSGNVRLGGNAQKQIAQGTLVVPNMPTSCAGAVTGTLWVDGADSSRVKFCP